MTARPIRYQRQVSDRKGKIFYTSITSLSHINKKTWVQGEMKNKYTDLMWDYYKKNEEKINPKRIFKKHYQHKKNKHGTKRVTVPKSVQWSMKHPFQGGGVSPR